MILDVILHVVLCSTICTVIHFFFHRRTHHEHELTDKEIKFLKEFVKKNLPIKYGGRRIPLTELRPDLLQKQDRSRVSPERE